MTLHSAYDDFQTGLGLLDSGDVHAAVVALERARDAEPDKGSVREALARAYFRTSRFEAARAEFARVVELDPTNDYGHFGLGLSLLRLGEKAEARGHLKLAVAMNPGVDHYAAALASAGG